MKPTFCKLAVVSLCSLLLFSCTKEEEEEEQSSPTSIAVIQMKAPIAINSSQYAYLAKNFENDKIRNTYGQFLIDSVSKLPGAKVAATAYNDADAFFPYLIEEQSYFWEGPNPPNSWSIDVPFVQYELRPEFIFPIRGNRMVISIVLKWDSNSAMYNPHSGFFRQPTPIITGPALGALEYPNPPVTNIHDEVSACAGNVSGDVIEKRTVAMTSEGKYLFKAGLDAPELKLGAEVSGGVTIVSSSNNISDFYYKVVFKCDFSRDQNPLVPVVSVTGTAKCTGTQRN